MGMFDTIIVTKELKCPVCKSLLSTSFQTKDLDNLLTVLKEGESYKYDVKKIYAYDYCYKCEQLIGQYFKFDTKGVLKRYKQPFVDNNC